jgi:phosphoribosyl 1,2-cyclic phosphodiesterase
MEVTFWGVRGSVPAPGPETNRYGGNTSCVSVRTAGGHLMVIDVGTGAIGLGRSLMATEFGQGRGHATVLLSHAHWDHIQGFPFFAPVFVAGNRFDIYGAARSSSMLEGILEGQMNPHFSPIYTIKNLGAQIQILAVPTTEDDPRVRELSSSAAKRKAPFVIDNVLIRALANPHGTTTALAYRLQEGDRSLVYAADAGYPPEGPTDAMLELYRDADVLIHDCTYSPEDRAQRLSRGFSSFVDAADAAARARVKHLVMFHYDQDYSDDHVDELRDRCRAELDARGAAACALTAAYEGLTIALS